MSGSTHTYLNQNVGSTIFNFRGFGGNLQKLPKSLPYSQNKLQRLT